MPTSQSARLDAPLSPAALIVDDVLLSRVVVAVALRQLGFRVTQAVEGEEALRRLEEGVFHVVCLDWNLPGLSGDEVARRILLRPDAPPIIAITADDDPDIKERCRRAGVAGHLSKGFAPHELTALLARLLPSYRAPETTSRTATPEGSSTRKLLINRSQEQFAAERVKFGQAMAERRRDAALRALHNIVSLSGLVGALSIHAAAQSLETRLRLGGPFQVELTALDASLGHFRPTVPPRMR